MIASSEDSSLDSTVFQLQDDLAGTLHETDRLHAQMEHMAAASHNLSELLLNTNLQNEKLLNLLVSVRSLVESSSAQEALRGLRDILVNVVGIAEFVVYALDEPADSLVPIGGAGEPFVVGARLPLRTSWIGSVVLAGDLLITPTRREPSRQLDLDAVAVVPLRVIDRVLGAIVVTRVLPQREALGACDRDILGLLGAYAATAIIAADRRSEWNQLPATLQ